jgi:hypothetical protein
VVWWNRQRSIPLSTVVGPPSAQWSRCGPVLRTGWSFLRKLPTSRANSRRDVAVPVATVASVGLAVAVAGDDGPALCCGPHSGLAADVEDSESGPRMIRLTEQSQASMRMVSTSTMSLVSVS